MKKILLLFSVFLMFLSVSTITHAEIITWDIVTTYDDLSGSITFDNTTIIGRADGEDHGDDLHIYGATLALTSTDHGINYLNTNAYFQPLTNQNDNKHIDTTVLTAGGDTFQFFSQSDSGNPAVNTGSVEYWLRVNSSYDGGYKWAFADDGGVNYDTDLDPDTGGAPVPEPATMLLFSLGLLGLAGVNRRKS